MRALIAGGGAAPATELPQLGALTFKLSADSLSQADGSAVASWPAEVGGVSATQGTGANQPIFKTNLFGTKPGVRFDGLSDFMTLGRPASLTTPLDSTTNTTVLVMRVNGAATNGMPFSAFAGGSGIAYMADGSTNYGNYPEYRTQLQFNGAGLNVMGFTTQPGPAYRPNTPLSKCFHNGTCYFTDQVGASTSGGNDFGVGGQAAGLYPAKVDMFEVLVWNVALTATEMLQVQKYVCDKYSQPYPWASLAYFPVFHGDSITASQNASSSRTSYPRVAAQSLSLDYGQYTNLGTGYLTLTGMTTQADEFQNLATLLGKPVRVVAFEYYNERGTAPATLQAAAISYCTKVRGFTNTKLVMGTSTSSSSDPDSNRNAYNAWWDANSATYSDAYAAIHTNSAIGISGAAATDANTTYFHDGIHLKDAGYSVLAGIMTTAIQAIP